MAAAGQSLPPRRSEAYDSSSCKSLVRMTMGGCEKRANVGAHVLGWIAQYAGQVRRDGLRVAEQLVGTVIMLPYTDVEKNAPAAPRTIEKRKVMEGQCGLVD